MTYLVAAIQMSAGPNKNANLERAERLVRLAAVRGANLVALPEVFNWRGRRADERAAAESLAGESLARMAALARELRIHHVFLGQDNKLLALDKILAAEKITADEVAYVGDDIIDLPVMRRCGLAVAVPNARKEVKEAAHFVTDHRGGDGAARDAVEFILEAKGLLQKVIDEYIDERNPISPAMDIGRGRD